MARTVFAASLFLVLPCAFALSQQPAPEPLFLAAPQDALSAVSPDPTFASESLVGVRSELLSAAPIAVLESLRLMKGLVHVASSTDELGCVTTLFF